MEWGVAIIGIVGSAVVAYLTAQLTSRNEMKKLREEQKLDFSIETAILHLMSNPNYKRRSLKKIKHHLRGFQNDDDLRMALLRAGAVAFGGEGENENWGLLDKNEEDVK